MVLMNLVEQTNKVHATFNQQKNMLDKKKMESLTELKRQKKLMAHKEQLIFELKQQKDFIKSQMAESLRQKQIIQKNEQKSKSSHDKEVSQKAERLEAHKLLVDKSNERILTRIEEMKIKRQREAITAQEKLVKKQQSAINDLRNIQKQKQSLQRKPVKMGFFKTQLEWIDLEINAGILVKTEKSYCRQTKGYEGCSLFEWNN